MFPVKINTLTTIEEKLHTTFLRHHPIQYHTPQMIYKSKEDCFSTKGEDIDNMCTKDPDYPEDINRDHGLHYLVSKFLDYDGFNGFYKTNFNISFLFFDSPFHNKSGCFSALS